MFGEKFLLRLKIQTGKFNDVKLKSEKKILMPSICGSDFFCSDKQHQSF